MSTSYFFSLEMNHVCTSEMNAIDSKGGEICNMSRDRLKNFNPCVFVRIKALANSQTDTISMDRISQLTVN